MSISITQQRERGASGIVQVSSWTGRTGAKTTLVYVRSVLMARIYTYTGSVIVGSKNFEREGAEDNLAAPFSFIAQQNICFLHGKKRLFEKKIWANRGLHPSLFESATG